MTYIVKIFDMIQIYSRSIPKGWRPLKNWPPKIFLHSIQSVSILPKSSLLVFLSSWGESCHNLSQSYTRHRKVLKNEKQNKKIIKIKVHFLGPKTFLPQAGFEPWTSQAEDRLYLGPKLIIYIFMICNIPC